MIDIGQVGPRAGRAAQAFRSLGAYFCGVQCTYGLVSVDTDVLRCMKVRGMCSAEIDEVADEFGKACSEVGSKGCIDASAFAQKLAEASQSITSHADTEGCRELIEFVVIGFDTNGGTSVISEVLFDIFEPLRSCGDASPDATKAFQRFIGNVTAICNPQETLTLFLATLGEASE